MNKVFNNSQQPQADNSVNSNESAPSATEVKANSTPKFLDVILENIRSNILDM